MNFKNNIRKKLDQKLINRGMLKTTTGIIVDPPKRMYKTLGEEVLWILTRFHIKLSVKELSDYLLKDRKIISKVMLKLTSTKLNAVLKEKEKNCYLYSMKKNYYVTKKHDVDISHLYKWMKDWRWST